MKQLYAIYFSGFPFPTFAINSLKKIIQKEVKFDKIASCDCCIYSEKTGEIVAKRLKGQTSFILY